MNNKANNQNDRRHVTVFGGSQPNAAEPAYQAALKLGQLLGESGYAVLTGGYIGTMEAVSRGAAEAGGHVIGVTCEEIERWRPVRPNQWVQEERRFATLNQRLLALINDCDAAMALPGGIGTLAEIAVMWSHMQTGVIARKPLILIGEGWRQTLATLIQTHGDYVLTQYRELLSNVEDVEAAFHLLENIWE